MARSFAEAVLAALLMLGLTASNAGAEACCPQFTRQLATGGAVIGTFAEATTAAGVPTAVTDEAARALGFAVDLGRDLRDSDHFYLRWEQAFALDGESTGDARLLWVELKTKTKGTIVVQRFKPRDGDEQFFLASGQAAAPPRIRMPLDVMKITSGYGPRTDPLDQPVILPPPPPAMQPAGATESAETPAPLLPEDEKEIARAFAGFRGGGQPPSGPATLPGGFDDPSTATINGVMARNRARRLAEERRKAEQEADAARQAAEPKPAPAPPPAPPPQLFMHTGLDLLANPGTPIHAAADGLVVGARPNGLYGNWIRIRHPGKLVTVYGHLQRFAPDIEPGTVVKSGDLIGFVGSTGRSTGAHLHFELLTDGHPVNPYGHPATKPRQLASPDFDRLRKQIAASVRERDLEHEAEETVALSLGQPMHPL